MGFVRGMKKTIGLSEGPEPWFKNYILKKTCRVYRLGWDIGREKEKKP